MNKKEAIKYLQQLYPNGGHCWLDEQRIEAIGMAIKALRDEPVSIWHDANEEPIKGKIILVVQDNGFPFVCDVRNDIGYVSLSFDHSNKTKIDGKDKWAYIEDLLKLSNIHKTIKNWKEPVSEDLGEYINELSKQFPEVSFAKLSRIAVRVAKWQKDSLWKPVDGDDLPEIDREVIALLNNGKVVFAHRPDPKGWDAKSIITEKVEHYTPKTYDKGGWNIPDVKWWLDCLMPKEIEL